MVGDYYSGLEEMRCGCRSTVLCGLVLPGFQTGASYPKGKINAVAGVILFLRP